MDHDDLVQRVGDLIGGFDPSELVHLRKNGYFYRPRWRGYTASAMEAGLYNRAEAEAHVANTEGVSIVEIDAA